MRLATYIKTIRRQGQRCFTLQQASCALNLTPNATRVAIHRLRTQGELISPAKGLYLILPPEHQLQGAIPPDQLLPILMQHWKADYYVSLLSAAQYYGATHQKSSRFQVVTNKRIKHPLTFGQVHIELIYKKSLQGLPTQKLALNTGYLNLASAELTLLDLLTYPTRSGGLNHIATVLSELIEAIDQHQLIALADRLAQKAWLQRLGYILEQIESMDQNKAKDLVTKLQYYLADKIKVFIPLAPELPKKGHPYVRKWMIIANTDIESDL